MVVDLANFNSLMRPFGPSLVPGSPKVPAKILPHPLPRGASHDTPPFLHKNGFEAGAVDVLQRAPAGSTETILDRAFQ